jgi:hypothetical protein
VSPSWSYETIAPSREFRAGAGNLTGTSVAPSVASPVRGARGRVGYGAVLVAAHRDHVDERARNLGLPYGKTRSSGMAKRDRGEL